MGDNVVCLSVLQFFKKMGEETKRGSLVAITLAWVAIENPGNSDKRN